MHVCLAPKVFRRGTGGDEMGISNSHSNEQACSNLVISGDGLSKDLNLS